MWMYYVGVVRMQKNRLPFRQNEALERNDNYGDDRNIFTSK